MQSSESPHIQINDYRNCCPIIVMATDATTKMYVNKSGYVYNQRHRHLYIYAYKYLSTFGDVAMHLSAPYPSQPGS